MPQWIPPAQFLAIQLLTGTTVAFTPANSPLRSIASLIVLILAYCMQISANAHLHGTRFGAPLVAMCWMNVLNGIDLLVLTRADYDKQLAYNTKQKTFKDKSPHEPQTKSLIDKYLWSLNLSFNYRRINTPWQIHALTTFNKTPTRTRFLLTSLLKLTISIAIIQLFTLETTDPYLGRAVDKLPVRPDEILLPFRYHVGWGKDDLFLRFLFTLSFGIVARAFIVTGYTAAAVVAVALGQEPSMWPPVGGGLLDAWSIRRFWGYAYIFLPFIIAVLVLMKYVILQENMAPNPPPTPLLEREFRLGLYPAPSGPIPVVLSSYFRVPCFGISAYGYGCRVRGAD